MWRTALLADAAPGNEDRDALGPGVCHEGYQSCFFRKLENKEWKVTEARAYDPASVYGN